MTDNHTKEIRIRYMSHIRSENTKPEEKVIKYLFAKGFRHRKNDKRYPGKPDIVLQKYNTIIFINGCFWHKHNCARFVWPSSNKDYWTTNITKNVSRDTKNQLILEEMGWKVITVWECELNKSNFQETMDKLIENLISDISRCK